jgi:uncharacterized membrane protein YkvA (DUF1232 family)
MKLTAQKILAWPSQLMILYYSLLDERTGAVSKFFLLLAAVYLVSPIDFIPDIFPLAGWVDDLIIVPFLLRLSFKTLPPTVLIEAKIRTIRIKRKLLLIGILWLIFVCFILLGLFTLIF